MMVILLRSHGSVVKPLLHCVSSLMVPFEKFRAKKRVLAGLHRNEILSKS